jgi:hypothetical protein
MTIQRIAKSLKYPIVNITIASNPMEPVIRDSTETLGRNFGKITIPPNTAPVPKEHNSNPKPVESSPNSFLAKRGKRDNNALLHNVNKLARTINTCAA